MKITTIIGILYFVIIAAATAGAISWARGGW